MAKEESERRLSRAKAEALPRAFAVTVVVAVVTVQWLPYSCSFAEAYPSEDLVVSLPGQPKVGFRQFAGYVNIDSKNGRSLLLLRGSRQTSRHYVPQLADAIHSYNIRSNWESTSKACHRHFSCLRLLLVAWDDL